MDAITIGKAHSSRDGIRTGTSPPARSARLVRFALFPAVALAAVLMAIFNVAAAAEPAPPPRSGEWNFQVLLDGKPIGEHRFRLETEGDNESRLTSEARFDVKVLGFTVYRYRHSAVEGWRGGCLVSMVSTTDDDGKPSHVQLAAASEGGAMHVAAANTPALDGCVLSFA